MELYGGTSKFGFNAEGTPFIQNQNGRYFAFTDTLDTFIYNLPEKGGTIALVDDLPDIADIKIINDQTFGDYHSFAAKCIELDTAETKAAYIGLISITTSRGSTTTTNKYYCLGLVKYNKRNNLDPTRTVTIISSNGEIMVSDGSEYSPISTPAAPVYDDNIVNLAYVKTLETRLTELENKVSALTDTGTTATVEDETLVVSNATVEGETLVVRGATVEGETLII